MSYNVSFNIWTGAPEPHCVANFNFTSNCAPMFGKAMPEDGLWTLHDKGAGYCITTLRDALAHMQEEQEEYKKLNPKNGWGDFDTAFIFLQSLLSACIVHKNCIIHVSC